jgi:asparagine synthase (glutamine-hydrolysing)
MCGIVAVASPDGAGDPSVLERMRDALTHRGPDGCGLWQSADGRVAFGHRRLAIVDLSPGGRQPMADGDNIVEVVLNGEIYNYRELRVELEGRGHRFRTASDTEVLLEAYKAWGLGCLSRLTGMFAFALFDERVRQVVVARDRAGEKPVFYRHVGRRLIVASELKALMLDPTVLRELNLEALDHYLAYGFVPGELCMLRGVRKLLPGHVAVYDVMRDTLSVTPYWTLPDPPPSSTADSNALVDELEVLLANAVRRQLHADVPVGILLSGGIDSSLVAVMACRAAPRVVKTFTVGFPGHATYDERVHARLVANSFGTEHHELVAEPTTVELLPLLARQYDEPLSDTSIVPTYLVSRLVRDHATVALGGDGGDELFGGYKPYSWLLRQERLRRYIPRRVRHAAGTVAGRLLPVGTRGRNFVTGYASDLSESIVHARLVFDARTRRRLLAPVGGLATRGTSTPEGYVAGLTPPGHSPVRRITATDFLSYMVDDILVKVDRASMLSSLEVRAPWLDHEIIEFAFGKVPDELRATPGQRKILARLLAGRVLPPQFDLHRKQGFSPPLGAWFKGRWGDYISAVLGEADAALFDRSAVAGLLRSQRRGFANTQRLFALTMFELWRREYGITVP